MNYRMISRVLGLILLIYAGLMLLPALVGLGYGETAVPFLKTILLTGNRHGKCEEFADIVIAAPERETYRIQELHLPIYHAICQAVEAEMFQ